MTDDLVKQLRTNFVVNRHPIFKQAADRIEQLEAALQEIANPDSWEGMDWISHGVPKWIARAALEKEHD
jgi:hypothetical protein